MSIKTKTVALLLVSLLITGVIIAGAGMFTLYRQILNSTEVTMKNQTVQLAAEVNDLFGAFNKNGKTYNNDNDFKSGDVARIQEKINTYFGVSYGVDRLNFIDLIGKRVAIAPYDEKVIGDNLSDRKFYKDTMKDRKTHISDVVINRVTGAPSVIVTQPVIAQDGQMSGMVLQAVNLETLQDFLGQIKVGSTGVIAIAANDGTLIVHSNRELVKAQKKISPDLMKRLTEQAGRLISYTDLAGRESVAVAVPVENTDWVAIASLPASEFRNGFYASLGWMAIALLFGLVLTGYIGRRFILTTLQPVEDLAQEAVRMAEGDLTVATKNSYADDEVGRLASSFGQMTRNLRTLMLQVTKATTQVAASSEELTAGAEQSAEAAGHIATTITNVAQGTEAQLQALDKATGVIEQISASIQKVASNANAVANQADRTAEAASEGNKAINAAVKQMGNIEEAVSHSARVMAKLGDRSQEIGQIVDTISGIAGQTNLLALNAAIEAARAGEQGRGFAVVAEEVRQLAEQCQLAAKQISTLISEIRSDTDKAVYAINNGTQEAKTGAAVVNNAGQAFREIVSLIDAVSAQIREISVAIEQMAGGSQQMAASIRDIDKVSRDTAAQTQVVSAATQEQAAAMEEIASSSQVLAKLAEELQVTVSKFKV